MEELLQVEEQSKIDIKSQALRMVDVYKENERKILDSVKGSKSKRKHYQAVSIKTAKSWLSAPPSTESPSTMDGQYYRIAVSRYLLLPLMRGQLRCPNCKKTMDEEGAHALLCPGFDMNVRHDFLVGEVGTLLKLANSHTRTEPPSWSNHTNNRPDIEAVGSDGMSVFLDVTVRAVDAGGSNRSLSNVFDSAEKEKMDKYDAFARERGATFIPLVMEANGGWSRTAQNYLDKIVLRYAMRKGMTAIAARTYWRRRFTMAVWRMNAKSLHKRMPNPGFRTIASLDT